MSELRVGLIGSGTLGAVHVASLTTVPGCRLVAVAGHVVSKAVAAAAERVGAKTVTPDEVLDPSAVDVVLIATPTDTHADYACRAIDAGQFVFCEKPLARTADDGRRVRDAAERRRAKVAVGHVVRYFPEYVAAKRLVEGGSLGTPLTARLRRMNTNPGVATAWYADDERSGGVLLDMAIHDVDWCMWTFGPVARVYAALAGDRDGDVASITLRHVNGVISYVDASWRDPAFASGLEVCGTEAMYSVSGSGSAGFAPRVTREASATYLPPVAVGMADDPYTLELQAAFRWFRGGPQPQATVGDACEAVRVVEAAAESARLGIPVVLEDVA